MLRTDRWVTGPPVCAADPPARARAHPSRASPSETRRRARPRQGWYANPGVGTIVRRATTGTNWVGRHPAQHAAPLGKVDQSAHWAPRPSTRALDAATTDSDLAAVGAPNQRALMPAPALHGPYVAPLVEHPGTWCRSAAESEHPPVGSSPMGDGEPGPRWQARVNPFRRTDRTGSHDLRNRCGAQRPCASSDSLER